MTDIATTEPYELLDDESGTDSLEIPAGASLLVTAPDSVGREFIAGRLGEGVRRLAATAHDVETVGTLRRALDGAVEVRDGDGLSARVVSLDGVPSDWHAFDR